MASAQRRLTDGQLATTELRITDPTAVERYVRERPDPTLAPEIIGHYDLTPAGGRQENSDGPWFWCCHCQKDNHWIGFVIANATNQRYSIGGDCAAAHYKIEFHDARRSYKDVLKRKNFQISRLSWRGNNAVAVSHNACDNYYL